MNSRFVMSAVVMAVMSLLLGFVVHGWLLAPDYKALGTLFRPEDQQMSFFSFMIAAHVLIGVGFTWIYRMAVSYTHLTLPTILRV